MSKQNKGLRLFSRGLLSSRPLTLNDQEADQGGISWLDWALPILGVVVITIWWYLSRRPEETAYETSGRQLAPEPLAPPEPEVVPAPPDDLALIEGIGPKIAALLQDSGIHTFEQLSKTEPGRLKELLSGANLRMANPESWPEQAKLAAAGDWDTLKAMQDSLKGGRRS